MCSFESLSRQFTGIIALSFAIQISAQLPTNAYGQRDRWQVDELLHRRHVTINRDSSKTATVAVCEFLTHGALDSSSPMAAVYTGNRQVSSRILQAGPGDFFRVAFQPVTGSSTYQVYYGRADAPVASPEWTTLDGLLLETRHWKQCSLTDLATVQAAFRSSSPFGSDFVPQVFHRHNPFAVQPGPLLSHYHGRIHVTAPGNYRFFTSSQDCSFLLIDGKQVVSSPGRHPPAHRARIHADVNLTAGFHGFDYWHAAIGPDTCAVAAWKKPGAQRLTVIGPEEFGSHRIVRVAAIRPEHQKQGPLPDMQVIPKGDVSVEGSPQWMIRAELKGAMVSAGQSGKWTWDFGDGQTSDQKNPTHIFMQPGKYHITLRCRRHGKTHETKHDVWITRPIQRSGTASEADNWEIYQPILDTYHPDKLNSDGLLQLVRGRIEHEQWREALTTGMTAFQQQSAVDDDQVRWQLANILGPVARVQLQDSQAAFELWNRAGKAIVRQQWRAYCAVAAADIALNELLHTDGVPAFLQYAQRHLEHQTGAQTSMLYRVWGDLFARQNNRTAAMAAYKKAIVKRNLTEKITQQTARRGALSRSAEAYLREHKLVLAREQLEMWQSMFPGDKTEGYLSMLLAQYWLELGQPDVVIAVTGDLLTVNPGSPYADRLVLVQASAEEKAGRLDRATAAYKSLLSDYPGSPLIAIAKKKLAEMKKAGAVSSEQ